MGRVVPAAALAAALSVAAHAQAVSLPQAQLDAIREHHTKLIMGSGQDLTNLQPDVRLYREIFRLKKNKPDQRELPEIGPIPYAQVFKKTDIPVGKLVTVAAAASGYDIEFHPRVNQNEVIKLNTRANSLTDLAEYLTRVSGAYYQVYPESRVLMAFPKGGAR